MKFNLSSNTTRLIVAGTLSIAFSSAMITPAFAEANAADSKKVDAAAVKTNEADFKKLDTNADGKISLKEGIKDKALANVFNVTDADNDGMLTTEEYMNYKLTVSNMNKDNKSTTN
jgi:Ca2+-binding EF-hand superfamily protein